MFKSVINQHAHCFTSHNIVEDSKNDGKQPKKME